MSERYLDRREALRTFGIAGAAGAIAGPALLAREVRGQSAPAPKKEESPPPAPAERGPEEPSSEAKRLGEIAKERYGQHLSEEQLRELVEDLDGGLKGAARLRQLGLSNADEPDIVFRAEL